MERMAVCNPAYTGAAQAMKAILKHHTEIDRTQWIAFLAHSPQGVLYAHPAYLDVVAPGWQGIEVWRDQQLLAIAPMLIQSKWGFHYALQPAFCQYWGIFFAPEPDTGNYKHFSLQRKITKAVVEVIPSHIQWYMYGFAPEFDYPHPFHWAGYTLKTRYTYRLNLEAGLDLLEKGFGSDTRYDIRKAVAAGIRVRCTEEWQHLSRLVRENATEGKQLLKPQELHSLERLAPFLLQERLGFLMEAVDEGGQVMAAALFGCFAGKAVYLMAAQSPIHKATGAMSLLLSSALQKAGETSAVFDFEGSMIEGIEGFFRGFGGRPVPYLSIEKNRLPLLVRWIRKFRS